MGRELKVAVWYCPQLGNFAAVLSLNLICCPSTHCFGQTHSGVTCIALGFLYYEMAMLYFRVLWKDADHHQDSFLK